MKTNSEFFKKYSWIKKVETVPESFGVAIYTTFDPHIFEDAFHAKTDEWEDEDGNDNSIDYFKVGNVIVILDFESFFIVSEDEDEITSALEYIDHAYHVMNDLLIIYQRL